jgi:hypothetical protein
MARTKKIEVITRDCNGEEVILRRRKIVLATFLTFGAYKPWRDWKLENDRKYELSRKLHNLQVTADQLLRDYVSECKYLKDLKKEVAADTRATKGISHPYFIDALKKELPFKAHKHASNPGESWRSMFSSNFLTQTGLSGKSGGSKDKTTRDKVGAPAADAGSKTKYVHEDYKDLSFKLEDTDIDHNVIYKEPNKSNQQQSGRKKGNQNNNNNNNNRGNNNNNNNRG